MVLEGSASSNFTKSYSEKFKEFKYNSLGNTGLFVSEVGFGGYKIDIRSPLNRDALKKAILSGINLIDTCSTFAYGNSEELIGDVVEELVNANMLSRESVVIVTKGGCLKDEAYEESQERKADGIPYQEIIEVGENFEYCIHPECLQEQIRTSLERLNLKTIDVYMIDTPETYLLWANNKKLHPETAGENYYKRIKKAFEHLESEVSKGRIRYYGICSTTFASIDDKFGFESLNEFIKLAEEISPEHHFKVIEFPMNLVEKGNSSNRDALFALAESKNIGVLISRPINAIYKEQLVRLAEPVLHNVPTIEAINNELENIRQLEIIISEKLKNIVSKEIFEEITNNLFVYKELSGSWEEISDMFEWKDKLNKHLLQRFHYYKNYIKNNSLKNEELEMDLFSCTFKIGRLFSFISTYFDNEYLNFLNKIKDDLAASVPELSDCKKLSHMAVHALRSTKGVTSVLVGMTQIPYVMDILAEFKTPAKKDFSWDKVNIIIE